MLLADISNNTCIRGALVLTEIIRENICRAFCVRRLAGGFRGLRPSLNSWGL